MHEQKETMLHIFQTHAEKWVQHFRQHRYAHIEELQTEVSKGIKNTSRQLAKLNVYSTKSGGRFRIIWFEYLGNPKKDPNKKKFFSISKAHSIHRSIFNKGPLWQEEIGNRCEDEFARIRQLQDLEKQIARTVNQFNKLASGDPLRRKYAGSKHAASVEPIPVLLEVNIVT